MHGQGELDRLPIVRWAPYVIVPLRVGWFTDEWYFTRDKARLVEGIFPDYSEVFLGSLSRHVKRYVIRGLEED